MKTEDVKLDIKEIFEKKKVEFSKFDIARMRYLCKTFIEFVLDMNQ